MENSNYLFQFIKGNKIICPNCGRKSFAAMVNTQTSEMTHYGKCDHLHSCGYRLIPTRDDVIAWRKRQSNTSGVLPYVVKKVPVKPPKEVYSLNSGIVTELLKLCRPGYGDVNWQSNRLYTYLFQLALKFAGGKSEIIPAQVVSQALREVLLDKYQVAFFAFGYDSAAVIYFQRRLDGSYATGKVMRYDDNGHRIKTNAAVGWVHALDRAGNTDIGKYKINRDLQDLQQCFFGEHLLTLHPKADVYIVESEKTALILSLYLSIKQPQDNIVVLATGGAELFNANHFELIKQALEGRTVTAIPDDGQLVKWKSEIQTMQSNAAFVCNWKIIDIMDISKSLTDKQLSLLPKGFDIADVLAV